MKSTYHLYIWRDSGKEVKQFIVVNCIGTPKLFCKFIDAWKSDRSNIIEISIVLENTFLENVLKWSEGLN